MHSVILIKNCITDAEKPTCLPNRFVLFISRNVTFTALVSVKCFLTILENKRGLIKSFMPFM